jgi:hypothetical protein
MKKLIVLSLISAPALLALSRIAHAQDAANDQTPTFYRLVPGTYVNGWPRFTIHYPKDWVEKHNQEPRMSLMQALPCLPCYPDSLSECGRTMFP